MRYSLDITIDLPREEVVELFKNPDNLPNWQPELLSFEKLSGENGEVGSTARMRYQMGKRETEMIETITLNDLPVSFHASYETKGVTNIQENHFEIVDANTTKWTSVSEFRFQGLMMKIVGALMPGSFKKMSYKFMQRFKSFAEGA